MRALTGLNTWIFPKMISSPSHGLSDNPMPPTGLPGFNLETGQKMKAAPFASQNNCSYFAI
jgi:hypothetical protein